MNETTANTPHIQGGKGLLPYHWKPGPVKLPAYALKVGLRVSGEHQQAQVDAVISDFFRGFRPGLEAHPP